MEKISTSGEEFDRTCSESARKVIVDRYLMRDPEDPSRVIETIPEMFERVARALAEVDAQYGHAREQVEATYREFLDLMVSRKGTPAGRTLANAGNSNTQMVANCVVLHIEDSMHDIFTTLRDASLLQQAGSGIGFPLHLLRPAGSIVKKSVSYASGPVSFLKIYNNAFGIIQQQNRHGANMAVMRVDHPDILDFIRCKNVEGDLGNFNISIGLTDEFMRQAFDPDYENVTWTCRFGGRTYKPRLIKRNSKGHIVADECGKLIGIDEVDMSAKDIFDIIVSSAWNNGEPGCVFLDTVNAANPLPGMGAIEACNPCGEQFLQDGDVCNLGSVNLGMHVSERGIVDYRGIAKSGRVLTHMLENVVDLLDFPVDRVRRAVTGNRRVGVGVMGFADMLFRARVRYGSEESTRIAERAMRVMHQSACTESGRLARERGNFPNWDKSVFAVHGTPRRNAAVTSIAPTGTISQAFDASGGMEPLFSIAYVMENVLNGKNLEVSNRFFLQECERHGIVGMAHPIIQYAFKNGSLSDAPESLGVPEVIKRVFSVAGDLTAEQHVRMQAAFQKWCDNSISKTINFPHSATHEDIWRGYYLAWTSKCKGCTVYRDGSRFIQVLNKLGEDSTIAAESDGSQSESTGDDDALSSSDDSMAASSSSSTDCLDEVIRATMFGGGAPARKKPQSCPDCKSVNTLRRSQSCTECTRCMWSACDSPVRSKSASPKHSKAPATPDRIEIPSCLSSRV